MEGELSGDFGVAMAVALREDAIGGAVNVELDTQAPLSLEANMQSRNPDRNPKLRPDWILEAKPPAARQDHPRAGEEGTVEVTDTGEVQGTPTLAISHKDMSTNPHTNSLCLRNPRPTPDPNPNPNPYSHTNPQTPTPNCRSEGMASPGPSTQHAPPRSISR